MEQRDDTNNPVRNTEVYCFGWGRNGQLGVGYELDSSQPVLVEDLLPEIPQNQATSLQLACSSKTTYALLSDGRVFGWGKNELSQITRCQKLGSLQSQQQCLCPTLVQFSPELARLGGLKRISARGTHCLGLDRDGGVWCWGANNFGQLGECWNDLVNRSAVTQTQSTSGLQNAFLEAPHLGSLGGDLLESAQRDLLDTTSNQDNSILLARSNEYALAQMPFKDPLVSVSSGLNNDSGGVIVGTATDEKTLEQPLLGASLGQECGPNSANSSAEEYSSFAVTHHVSSGATSGASTRRKKLLKAHDSLGGQALFFMRKALSVGGSKRQARPLLKSTSVPRKVHIPEKVHMIAAGRQFCVVVTDGVTENSWTRILTWGNNEDGQLGIGSVDSFRTECCEVDLSDERPSGGRYKVTHLAAGSRHVVCGTVQINGTFTDAVPVNSEGQKG